MSEHDEKQESRDVRSACDEFPHARSKGVLMYYDDRRSGASPLIDPELEKLRRELWIRVYAGVATDTRCTNGEIAMQWADSALIRYDMRCNRGKIQVPKKHFDEFVEEYQRSQ